jgi:hypothetical protein
MSVGQDGQIQDPLVSYNEVRRSVFDLCQNVQTVTLVGPDEVNVEMHLLCFEFLPTSEQLATFQK